MDTQLPEAGGLGAGRATGLSCGHPVGAGWGFGCRTGNVGPPAVSVGGMASDSQIVTCPSCGTKNRVPVAASGKPSCASCKAPLPWLTIADDRSFAKVVLESKVPVLVDLWAPWCGPCRMVSPIVERMAAQYAGRLKVTKVNVDESPAVARDYDAMSIPTLLLVKGGKVVDRMVGAVPETQLTQFVSRSVT